MSGSLGVLTLDLVAKTVNFEQPLKKAEQQAGTSSKNIVSSMEKVEKQSEATSRAIGTFGTTLKASLAAISIGSVVRIADEYTQTAARISQATKSTAEYDMVQKHLYNTANGTYRSLKEAQEVYLATSGGLQELGYNTQQVLAISDSLSYSFVHNATSADKAQSAMDSYGRILDKGKVDADGWISLMGAAPNILSDVSKATGKSTAEIRKLGAEGKLAAADLHKGLLLSADGNKALADAMVNSAADGGQKLSNAISRTVGELNRGTGATGIFADGLGIVADNIDVVAGGVAVAAAYMAGTYLSALGTSTVAGYAKVTAHIAEVKALQLANEITAVRTARIVQSTRVELANAEAQAVRMTGMQRVAFVEKTLIPLRQANETALKADTIAQNANNASKLTAASVGQGLRGILGGPVGLGMTVATVAASYLLLSNNAEKNTVSLRENNGAVGDAIQKYSELSAIQRTDQIAAEKKKLEELNEQYRKSSTELMVYATNMGSVADVQTQSQAVLSQLFSQYKETGDLETFNRNVQSSGQISQDAKDKVANLASSVEKVGIEAKTQKAFIGQLNGEFNNTRAAASGAAGAIRDVAAATSEYTSSLNSRLFDAAFKNGVVSRGKTEEEANLLLEAYRENEKKGIQGVTLEQKKRIAEIVNQGKITEQRRKAELDASKLARASAKSDASEAKRQAEEAKRLNEEIAQLKYEVNYRYSTREVQLQYDLEKEKSEIRKAFSDSPAQMANYLAWAQKKHDAEKQLYEIELGYELYAFKMNEEEKLNVQREIENRRIGLMAESFKGERETRRKALNEEHERNIAWAKLEVQQRISDAGESLRTDIQNLDIQYDYERRRIELNSEYAKDEKRQLIALSKAAQDLEKRQMNQDAIANWGGTFAEMTGTRDQYSLSQTRFRRTDESQDVFDTSMALAETAAEREAIWQAHHDRMQMIETDYQISSMQLQASYGEQIAGSLTTIFGAVVGEQSAFYQVAFAAEKSFAVAQAALALGQNIAMASKIGFPQNIPMITAAFAQGAQIASIINSVAAPQGYATGGLITGPGTGTSDDIPIRASNGEFMMRYAATQKIGIADLNYMNRYGEIPQRQSTALTPKVGSGLGGQGIQASVNVVVENYTSGQVQTKVDEEGRIRVIIREEVDKYLPGQMNNSNSKIHKAFVRNTTATTKR